MQKLSKTTTNSNVRCHIRGDHMHSWYDIVQMMKTWVDNNIFDLPPLHEISEFLGYSYCYATKKFHQIEGISFQEYVTFHKLQQAALDLYTTKERILDISIRYGYSSQESFTRAFIKVFGITPATYRKMHKPTIQAEKCKLLINKQNQNENGGIKMKLYVKQMYDWNFYAYFAEDVDEKYWDYFKDSLWWQIGNNFVKQYADVKDFEYCAQNFTKYGEIAIKQQLKLLPTPWKKSLDLLIVEMEKLNVDWYIHGSTAMALWNINVSPKNIDICIPNYSDFDKVRNHFYKSAYQPFERCENWVASGLGYVFLEAAIEFSFGNKELEPYDMSTLHQVNYNGKHIYISNLHMLKRDNEHLNRPERVSLIERKMEKLLSENT